MVKIDSGRGLNNVDEELQSFVDGEDIGHMNEAELLGESSGSCSNGLRLRVPTRVRQRFATWSHFFLMPVRWASAEPAALLEAGLVRPSRRTADAAVAAFADVTLGGATCDNALPAADFDVLPVELFERTEEELFAALALVIFVAI